MTKPRKVIGFLDFAGAWDASLAFVMLGAVSVHFLAYRVARKRSAPLLGGRFAVPTRRDIDRKLVAGAALFGVGWALSGYCPGPALVSLASTELGIVTFVTTMLLGMWIAARLDSTATANCGS
jgi:uncharacterized membrane protein YedE/YeeE